LCGQASAIAATTSTAGHVANVSATATEATMPEFELAVAHAIRAVGSGIEIFGVLIIVCGIVFATYRMLLMSTATEQVRTQETKIRIGRWLLLGLEVLVAADIVKTIAIELTFTSLGLLAGLVVVRTFLSWTLTLEIEGRWPWQRRGEQRAASSE